jgi:Leucine-rich repeat (LRR) protein
VSVDLSHLPSILWLIDSSNPDLSCLRHLRELRADGNQITSTDGLQALDSLVKLSLQGNRIRAVDFSSHRWCGLPVIPRYSRCSRMLHRPRLEMLNMSDNKLDSVEHLEVLSSVVALNLGAC